MGFAGGGGRDGAWLLKTVTALPLLSHQRRVLSHEGGLRGFAGTERVPHPFLLAKVCETPRSTEEKAGRGTSPSFLPY